MSQEDNTNSVIDEVNDPVVEINNDSTIGTLVPRASENLPEELTEIYHLVYNKINDMLVGRKMGLASDLTFVRLMIENAMEVVENFKDANGQGWSGAEKKQYALSLIRYVIKDLKYDDKIEDELAEALIATIDLFGSEIIDLVFDALKNLFNIGQEIADDISEHGCRGCWRRNC